MARRFNVVQADEVMPGGRDLTLAGNSPEYRELADRYSALGVRSAAIYGRLAEMAAAARAKSKAPVPPARLPQRVAELVGDPSSGPAQTPRESQEASSLQSELRDIAAAQEELRARMVRLRPAASRAALAKVEPELRARVKRVAAAMKTLAAEYGGLLDLIEELNGNDLQWAHLGPPHALFLGDPRKPVTPIPIWLKNMAGYGWI